MCLDIVALDVVEFEMTNYCMTTALSDLFDYLIFRDIELLTIGFTIEHHN